MYNLLEDVSKGINETSGSTSRISKRTGNLWEVKAEAQKTPYFTTLYRPALSTEEIDAINNGGVIVGDYKKVKPIKLGASQ